MNEPKLQNIAIVDLYVLVSCRETSIIDYRDFMATVVTPHEVLMALWPNCFPWQCKIITDFRLLLVQMESFESSTDQTNQDNEEDEKTAEELAEELED